ncbi:MAG: DPP IV N-terminal domain-containing protein [Ignavibacteriae bacterium]|nr:DPP IV N-terminal domain-containing protein [Ignavibacteriota bacterium]
MKPNILIIIIFFVLNSLLAQKKNLTIENVVFDSYSKLAPKTLKQLEWIPNTNNVSYIDGDSVLVEFNTKTNIKNNLIYLSKIKKIFNNSKLGNQFSKFPNIKWIDSKTFTFWNKNYLVSFNLKNNSFNILNKIPAESENSETAPNNILTAFTIGNNLFASLDSSNSIQITNEENKEIVSGQTVSRSEFGINDGIFWSPKSNYLAFYQKDESNVSNYPLVEIGETPAKLKNIKYPMAGQNTEIVKVGVYNFNTQNTIWLNTGEPFDQYLTNISWDPTEKYIFISHLNRDQNHLRLIKYDALTGKQLLTLFEEKDNEYVEPENELTFLPNDPTKFLWFSERDNWQHIYLYDINGKLIKQITSGNWVVKEILGFDKNSNSVFIIATKDSPIEDNAYKVNLKSGKISRITKENANHKVKYNSFNNNFIDTFTNLEIPSISNIINEDGEIISQLNKSENPISDFEISKPKIFALKDKNNIDLYCRIILPTNFDETKKYPVIVYVYGGPHAQLVTNNWYYGRYDFWFQYMAQKGYIVFTLDNKGSANRGLEFEQAIFRNLGTVEIEDQLVGINYLKNLNYIDQERIGVFGWSYGGFMTTSLILRTNNTFKVGVGGGAVIDWKFYEIMYGERYMDTPEANPEGYKNSSLLNYVENLNGKLLLVHGTSDPTVVLENTLEFAKKAANLNKPLDFYPYVGHGHGVGGKDALHLYTKISNYFFDNL